jgi:putative tryptophan/tyrosine transport system substrate-binding protein
MEEKLMKKNNIRKMIAGVMATVMCLALAACGSTAAETTAEPTAEAATETEVAETAEVTTYTVGICNYVDDASLNQIVENIQNRLAEIGEEKGVNFEIKYDNCNADASVMEQIIADFIADDVDLMVGVATPVAMRMQSATEGTDIPVVFSAVSDPVSAGLVESLEAPGANLTGTSDYLDTTAVMNLIFALDPDAAKIGLLYDQGQDSSTSAIAAAKAHLDELGIEYVERTGTTTDEIMLAAQALVADGVDAVFTPQDNTVMTAELAIYETFAEAGIPQYTGADSFALNGAFLGYGVDYANLGVETANMVASILLDGASPATTPVMTFDNGTATVNTEICAQLGYDFADVEAAFAPYCTAVKEITTAESFDEAQG